MTSKKFINQCRDMIVAYAHDSFTVEDVLLLGYNSCNNFKQGIFLVERGSKLLFVIEHDMVRYTITVYNQMDKKEILINNA